MHMHWHLGPHVHDTNEQTQFFAQTNLAKFAQTPHGIGKRDDGCHRFDKARTNPNQRKYYRPIGSEFTYILVGRYHF